MRAMGEKVPRQSSKGGMPMVVSMHESMARFRAADALMRSSGMRWRHPIRAGLVMGVGSRNAPDWWCTSQMVRVVNRRYG